MAFVRIAIRTDNRPQRWSGPWGHQEGIRGHTEWEFSAVEGKIPFSQPIAKTPRFWTTKVKNLARNFYLIVTAYGASAYEV